MKSVTTIFIVCSTLIFAMPAFSSTRKKPIKSGRSSNLSPVRTRPLLSLQAKNKILLLQSKFKALHSQAIGMARKDLDPNADYEGELITALEVMGKHADILSGRSLDNMGIDELAQLVMFETWANEEENLRDLLDKMHSMNKARQKQRELVDSLRKQKADFRKSLIDGLNGAPRDTRPVKKVIVSRSVDLISGSGSEAVVDFITDVVGSRIEVTWVPVNRKSNASLVLNGPGKATPYQRSNGIGVLKIAQDVTPQISELGRLWQVSVSAPKADRYFRFAGRLTLTYMAHYSQPAQRVSARKTKASGQTRKNFDQQMNDFYRELENIQKATPKQAQDFAVREAVRSINRTSNLFGTAELAIELDRQGVPNLLDAMRNNLDSMNEMSEMTSLRLQMTMDRRSKFISTLSQMMKKISTTQDTLVQNLK